MSVSKKRVNSFKNKDEVSIWVIHISPLRKDLIPDELKLPVWVE